MSRKFDEQLRQEALAEAALFSESLHHKVMAKVLSEPLPTAAASSAPRFPSGWLVGTLAIAATLVIALCGWKFGRTQRPERPLAPSSLAQVPSLSEPAARAGAIAVSARRHLSEARFAYLDRDAMRLAIFVKQQVDVVPVENQ